MKGGIPHDNLMLLLLELMEIGTTCLLKHAEQIVVIRLQRAGAQVM
jgi:hypothetical protein